MHNGRQMRRRQRLMLEAGRKTDTRKKIKAKSEMQTAADAGAADRELGFG